MLSRKHIFKKGIIIFLLLASISSCNQNKSSTEYYTPTDSSSNIKEPLIQDVQKESKDNSEIEKNEQEHETENPTITESDVLVHSEIIYDDNFNEYYKYELKNVFDKPIISVEFIKDNYPNIGGGIVKQSLHAYETKIVKAKLGVGKTYKGKFKINDIIKTNRGSYIALNRVLFNDGSVYYFEN